MAIPYRRVERWAEILNPLKGFKTEKQLVEHRFDPLTGSSTVIAPGRFEYVKRLFQSDFQLLEKAVTEARDSCPFCPENIHEKTPKFPSSLIPEGRVEVGESTIFPGLFAHMEFNAIAVLSRGHRLEPRDFAPERILNVFRGGIRYLKAVHRAYPDVKFAAFVGNYLPPAGSSIFHPHVQILASDQPLLFLKQLHEASRGYAEQHSSNFWLKLLEEESHGERYVGSTGSVKWLTPFAPMRTFEVWGIDEKASSLLELDDESLRSIADGLARVLACYSEGGFSCFNFILYSGPLGEDASGYFRAALRIALRFGYRQPFINDVWGLQSCLMEGESYESPEEVAKRLRKYF